MPSDYSVHIGYIHKARRAFEGAASGAKARRRKRGTCPQTPREEAGNVPADSRREAGRRDAPPERRGTPRRSRTAEKTTEWSGSRSGVDIIISNASGKPIYEQITSQMKNLILDGTLAEGTQLPSIRMLANDLKVSVITTKRAYADLEAQGFVETVPGKGSFVAGGNMELLREERLRRIEGLMAQAVDEAKAAGVARNDLHDMLDLLLEG